MRAREILQEDYNQSLESDLTNLLVAAKASGAQTVNTQDVAQQLYGMGYSVDANSLVSILQNNPGVTSVTPQEIVLTSSDGSSAGNTQDSADLVGDMAQKASTLE